MPLNDLDIDQLMELSTCLLLLTGVGQQIKSAGYDPRFDLTPGRPMRITLDQEMPAVGDPGFPYPPRPAAMSGPWSKPEPPSTEAAPGLTRPGDMGAPSPGPVEQPPSVPNPDGGTYSHGPEDAIDARAFASAAPIPEDAPASRHLPQVAAASEAATESGGGQASAAAVPPAAPAVGSASALAATTDRKLWTEAEDARLVELVADGVVRKGLSKKAAIIEAALGLGRPEAGTAFRCHHKLKARIDAALTAAAMAQAQTEIPEIPSPEAARQAAPTPQAEVQGERAEPHSGEPPASEPEPGAGGHDEPIMGWQAEDPAPAIVAADPLTAHLMALTDKGGWTVERDHELMELSIAGWPPNEIAAQLQMPDKAIKPRFDALTGLHDDEATGKKLRRFTREEVFAALTRLAGRVG